MGTQPFNAQASREGFPKGNLFSKPRATFLVTLDSLSPGLFAKQSSWKDYQSVDLVTKSYPANTHSVLSNLATGVKPSVHGIVGKSWVDSTDDEKHDGTAVAANMADVLAQEWNGASLTVSAAASASLASTFSAKEQFSSQNTYSISLKNGALESMYFRSASPLSLDKQELLSIFQDASFSKFLGGATFKENKFTINVDSRAPVIFDLADTANYELFAELSFVYNLLNVLGSDASLSVLVNDATPDFLSVVFSSLKAIRETRGENSEQYAVAVTLISRVVAQAFATMDKLYAGRVVSAVVCLNVQSAAPAELKESVFAVAKSHLINEKHFDTFYPSLYVRTETLDQLCDELKSNVASPSVVVHCFVSSTYEFYELDPTNNTNGTNSTTDPHPLNVANFWIVILVSVVLFLFILLGVYSLLYAGISASNDSLLFRSAGRHQHQN